MKQEEIEVEIWYDQYSDNDLVVNPLGAPPILNLFPADSLLPYISFSPETEMLTGSSGMGSVTWNSFVMNSYLNETQQTTFYTLLNS